MHHNDSPADRPGPTDADAPVSRPDHSLSALRRRPLGRALLRRRYLLAALAAAVGVSLVGVAVAGAGTSSREVTATSIEERNRAAGLDRADRAHREPLPTATATADPTPTGAVTPTPGRAATAKATASQTTKAKPKPKAAWVNPMPGADTTSCYGMRWGALHAGVDLAMPANTPIRAAGGGTVVEAGWAYAGYGISVVVDHGNGYLTHYAHLNRAAVAIGDKVSAGKVIGYEGSTGDSTGPHLHFEVHNGLWNQLDPAPWMRSRGVNLGC